ncbi:MAG: hypothetical protein RLZZ301_313 [Bacteroidota bacterium]
MIPFLKLIRFSSLVVIKLSMIGVVFNLYCANPSVVIDFQYVDFILLLFSTLIIAAAGFVINDYFDLKADRINHPEGIVLERYLKKRWAILLHWSLNALAVLIALYLSIKYESLVFLFVHLLSINLLWFYSVSWKRKLLLGNVVIALLPALVLLLPTWYLQVLNESSLPYSPFHAETWSTYLDYRFVHYMAVCAFFVTLSRELIKDIQDMPGDTAMQANTIPRKIGVDKTGWLALILLQIPALLFLVLIGISDFEIPSVYGRICLGGLSVIFASLLVAYKKQPEKVLKFVAPTIKWGILVGLTCLFF